VARSPLITYWSTQAIAQHPFYQEADVLHFHNLHGGYFNYLFLPYLTRNKPAVYTLHDMWGFTGHCSYSFDCNRWQKGCGSCPYSLLSAYGIQLNPTCRESIILSLENDGGFLYPLIDK
jgi:hypothetical protein